MPSTLVKPELELSPLSLVIFADVAESPKSKRRFDRVDTLLTASTTNARTKEGHSVPWPVQALEKAGLVEIRRATRAKTPDATPGWSVEITDKGLELHRRLMATLRNAGALTAQ